VRQNDPDLTHYKANKVFDKLFSINGLNLFIRENEWHEIVTINSWPISKIGGSYGYASAKKECVYCAGYVCQFCGADVLPQQIKK
jgi:hypothetical protein